MSLGLHSLVNSTHEPQHKQESPAFGIFLRLVTGPGSIVWRFSIQPAIRVSASTLRLTSSSSARASSTPARAGGASSGYISDEEADASLSFLARQSADVDFTTEDVKKCSRWLQRVGDSLMPWYIFLWTVLMEIQFSSGFSSGRTSLSPTNTSGEPVSPVDLFQLGAASAWQDVLLAVFFFHLGMLWERLDQQRSIMNIALVLASHAIPLSYFRLFTRCSTYILSYFILLWYF